MSTKFASARCYAVSRPEGLQYTDNEHFLCIDSYKDAPADMKKYSCFNPFYFHQDIQIPVPGYAPRVANSLESIWQGLKIVEGTTCFEMFTQKPYKRPTDAARRLDSEYIYAKSSFHYLGQNVDLLTARFFIYFKSYCWLLEHLVDQELLNEIKEALTSGKCILFYDWDDNFNIFNINSSFSHSAICCSWFNGELEQDFFQPGYQHFPTLSEVFSVEGLPNYQSFVNWSNENLSAVPHNKK